MQINTQVAPSSARMRILLPQKRTGVTISAGNGKRWHDGFDERF